MKKHDEEAIETRSIRLKRAIAIGSFEDDEETLYGPSKKLGFENPSKTEIWGPGGVNPLRRSEKDEAWLLQILTEAREEMVAKQGNDEDIPSIEEMMKKYS